MQARNVDFKTALRQAAEWLGEPLNQSNGAAQTVSKTRATSSLDWLACVKAFTKVHLFQLTAQRGYSRDFVSWLNQNGFIGIYEGCFAFPVHDKSGNVVAAHYRSKNGRDWFYHPNGVKTRPLVIGKLVASEPVHVFESQWDAFSFMDKSGVRSGIIITRGASNGKLVAGLIPASATLYAWQQNDELKNGKRPGDEWLKDVVQYAGAKVLCPKTPEQFKDLNDWTSAGAKKKDLLQMMDEAREAAVEVEVQSAGDVEPVEFPPPPSPYVPPPLDLLPSVLQDYVHAAAESLNVNVAFILLPLLSSLGSAIGNSRSILLKPGFIQPPVIWTAIVGPSGSRKSPAIEYGCLPVMEHERDLMRQNNEAAEIYTEDLGQWESQKGKGRGNKPEKPQFLTCTCDDLTIEVLADRLVTNPRGLLVRKDELSHWLSSFDLYKNGKGSDVARWLSLHTAVFLAVDRKTDNLHHRILQPRVCITGGIQPAILRRLLTPEFFERGLPARFLFAFPPFRKNLWSEAIVPDDLCKANLELFERLWLLHPEHGDHGQPRPKVLPLAPDAKAVFVEFYNECGEFAMESDEHGEYVLGKLTGYAARLALVGQLARDPKVETVTGATMQAACELARWFGNEAVRIYAQLAETQGQREQRELCEFVERRGGAVYEREVMQSFTRLKNNKDGTARELDSMVKSGRGKWEPVPTTERGGRPARKFQILRSSTSTQPRISRGKTGSSVDVDTSSTQKITPSRDQDKQAESVIGDELGVARL